MEKVSILEKHPWKNKNAAHVCSRTKIAGTVLNSRTKGEVLTSKLMYRCMGVRFNFPSLIQLTKGVGSRATRFLSFPHADQLASLRAVLSSAPDFRSKHAAWCERTFSMSGWCKHDTCLRPYLTECIYQLVLEGQLPTKSSTYCFYYYWSKYYVDGLVGSWLAKSNQ